MTAQTGSPRLDAVQVLMPVQGIDMSARPPSVPAPALLTAAWFAEADPQTRTAVRVNVNSGRDPSVADVARELAEYLGGLEQDVFALARVSWLVRS